MEESKQGKFLTHLLNGNNAVIRNDMETAVAEYELALHYNPDFFLTYTKLGHVYYKTENYEKAIEFFRKSLDMNPEQTATLYQLGKSYHKVGMNVQAAVAYDMAMEKDRGGDYTSAIETRKRRIRQHSSGRSLNELRTGEVISKALSIFLSSPGLLFPYILVVILLFGAHTTVLNILRSNYHEGFKIVTAGEILFQTPSEANFPVLIYYGIMTAVVSLLCVPLYTASMIDAHRIYRKLPPLKAESITTSFGQISPLAALAFILIVISILCISAGVFVLDIFEKSMQEFFHVNLPLHPLAIFALPWILSYAIHAFPCIAIEKHQMESGIKKGIRYGKKYSGITMMILSIYTVIHLIVAHFIPDITLGNYTIHKTPLSLVVMAPLQAISLISVAMMYSMGQEVKKKASPSSRRRSRSQAPEEYEEPEYDKDEMIIED